MGQYWEIYNLDKQEKIQPWSFDDGAKYLHFMHSNKGMLTALGMLITDWSSMGAGGGDSELDSRRNDILGRWTGDRIIILGDYNDDERYLQCKEFRDISEMLLPYFKFLCKE